MKVLVFTSLYPNNVWPNNGVFIKERMTSFAKLDGCEVKVIAPVPYFPRVKLGWRWRFSQVEPRELRDGIDVYHPQYFMTPKVGMCFYGLAMFLSVLNTVKRMRRNFNFDLIDAHWVYPDGLAAVLLGQVFKKPVVVSARGSDINLYSHMCIIRRLVKYTLQKSDGVIAVSQALKNKIVKLGISENKICVIPNGVDSEKFHPVPKEEARNELGLPIDSKVILSVGHLTPNKGFDLLMKAMRTLSQHHPERNHRLMIVGDGIFREALEKLALTFKLDRRVHFTGNVSHEKLSLYYSAADLFCLASEMEGWPNVLLESLACGTPVVATGVGGIPEIVKSDKLGLLIERNEAMLTNAIETALNKSWESSELIGFAKEHSWRRVAGSLHHNFDLILRKNKAAS